MTSLRLRPAVIESAALSQVASSGRSFSDFDSIAYDAGVIMKPSMTGQVEILQIISIGSPTLLENTNDLLGKQAVPMKSVHFEQHGQHPSTS